MARLFNRIRHLRDRAVRRAKRLAGRIDNSPWAMLPSPGSTPANYADFLFALDYLSVNSRLLRLMHEAMAPRGLSCLLVNSSNVERILQAVRARRWRPVVYLDLCCRPGDAFEKLLHATAEAGSGVLAHPKVRDWTEKSYSHPRLHAAGLPLPPTVIINAADPDRELTPDQRSLVGERCVIKPSYGVAGLGAVIGVQPTRAAIASARDYDRRDDWLVQKMISWGRCGDRPAYLRAYSVLGRRTLMWWSVEHGYANLTWDDLRRFDLVGALELVDQLRALTGLEFFSTEIAIIGEPGANQRFCLIDYLNDQCDIDPEAQPNRSPPRSWVSWVCDRLAEFTWRKKHRLADDAEGTIYLAD